MDPRLRPKSDLYVFGGYVLLGLALLINPLTLKLGMDRGWIPSVPSHHFHKSDIQYLLPGLLALLSAGLGASMTWAPKRLGYYFNESFLFNLLVLIVALGIMFSLNVIQPGQYKFLRIPFLLGMLFLLTNTLYQAVVKQRDGREIHPFYRNLAVAIYGIVLILLLMEGIFMFHQSTHRFNGTLGSRAWFLNHWELNAEGYRDAPYDSASASTRKKILVIGDSFVAGHGVRDRKDRFSDQLQALIPGEGYRVYNLGVGGSDTRDENKRLREFPYKPDILVFSWYPNDIEQDGELAGLMLQHARSYHDIPGLARYFVRRSYLWNYIYWRYPHPDELSDYFGYIQQCFSFLKVRIAHLREVDRLVAYGDSLGVPMAAVVFPFLENAEGSEFATSVIEERFRGHGVPTLGVRDMLLGKPAIDYIVNQNDPHPNERLHKMVADSLYLMLMRQNAFSAQFDEPDGNAEIEDAQPLSVKSDSNEPTPLPAAQKDPIPSKPIAKLDPQASTTPGKPTVQASSKPIVQKTVPNAKPSSKTSDAKKPVPNTSSKTTDVKKPDPKTTKPDAQPSTKPVNNAGSKDPDTQPKPLNSNVPDKPKADPLKKKFDYGPVKIKLDDEPKTEEGNQ